MIKNIEQAQKMYDRLPPQYQEIAKEYMANIILGKDKENEDILKLAKQMAEKENVQ